MNDSPEQPTRTEVGWIPAHPVYGAVSMRRYWQALSESVRADDPFTVRSIIEPADMAVPPGIRGMAARYWQRGFGYPAEIRRRFRGEIGHVLDHSWADMLPQLPAGTRKVVTVHDLIPLRFPGELTDAQARRFQGWVSHVRDAHAVIADSAYTKGEVTELLGVLPDRIQVVPCGVELPTLARTASPLVAALPGVMTVGSIGSTISRKNLSILPASFAKYRAATDGRVRLVRVGAPLPAALATDLREVLGEGGLIELGFLSDADVGRFYQSMDAVVVPSLYEGFGLPVLESLAHGVPVISSNATSLPEVGGDEALYFDPASPENLAQRLADIRGGMPAGWRDRALARAAQFSWRNSLLGIYDVYQRVMAIP